MNELPQEVRRLLQQGQRQAAIELLCLHQHLSEEEAARRVDLHLEERPTLRPRGPAVLLTSKLNALVWAILIALMILVALIFSL